MKRKKIYKWQLEQKINDIVKNMQINKYSSEEKEILFNLLQKVLLNEQTKENKNKLLEVIKNVNCYTCSLSLLIYLLLFFRFQCSHL